MRPAWASLCLVAVLIGCEGGAAGWRPVAGTPAGGGLELSLAKAWTDDASEPYKRPLPGSHCVVYRLQVRATDGHEHDLRPEQFRAGTATPLDAIGRCFSPQLEPTWIGPTLRTVEVTILERGPTPAPLEWRP